MCTSFYCLPLETWSGCKVQENRDLPDMLQAEKCLPGLPAGSWIWSTSSGPGYSARHQFERCNSKEWCQSWIFCRRAWSKGMFCFFIIEIWMLWDPNTVFLRFFSFILKLSYVFKYHFYDDIVNKLMVSSTILCLGNTNRMSFLWCPICICNLPDLP